jgi:hypothetical protein
MRLQFGWRAVVLLSCLGAALSSHAQTATADDVVLDQVTKIFAAIEGPSEKKSSPDAAFLRLQKVKPADSGAEPAQYAYLLGLVEIRKHREAVVYAGNLIERNPYDVLARLLRARLWLREKKFAQVFADLEMAGKAIAEQTKQDPLSANTEAACRALGLMFGYLEGPAKPLVKATMGKGVKEHLLASISPAAQKVFAEQYTAVLDEQQELIDKGEAAFRELQAKHRAASEAAVEQTAKLEAARTQAAETKQASINRLTKQWDSLKADYDRLAVAFANMQTTQQALVNQRAQFSQQLSAIRPREPTKDKNGNVDPTDRRRYNDAMQQYNQLAQQLNVFDQQLLQGAVAMQQLWNQGMVAENRLVQLQEQGERLGAEFAMTERAFAKEEAKIARTDPTKKKLPAGPAKQLEQAFAQYDDFNYFLEKQRLLDSLHTVPVKAGLGMAEGQK